jgi:DNA-binding MarR family transcriptional regulator
MASAPSASPLFLREPELRRGLELLYFGNSHITRAIDRGLAAQGLGRAHHRALYFIARKPDMTVSELLALLAITKQSLGRVLNDLSERGLVETRPGERDRRQRLLRLTAEGAALETELFDALREKLSAAYARAGQHAVSGFWAVLEGLIPDGERDRLDGLRARD